MKTVQINTDKLREILVTELTNAEGSTLSGWRIPIYVDPETGEFSSGGWLSNNSWQPDAVEVPVKVEPWHLSDVSTEANFDEEWTREDEVKHFAEEAADFHIEALREKLQYDPHWGNVFFEIKH